MKETRTVETKQTAKEFKAIFNAMGVTMENGATGNARYTVRGSVERVTVDNGCYVIECAAVEITYYRKENKLVIIDRRA